MNIKHQYINKIFNILFVKIKYQDQSTTRPSFHYFQCLIGCLKSILLHIKSDQLTNQIRG